MAFFLSYKYIISSFIKLLQKNGLKESSELCLNFCFCFVKKSIRKKPFFAITESFYKSKPFCEVKGIKISGINYKLPVEIKPERQKSIFLRWLLTSSLKNSNIMVSKNISKEIISVFSFSSKSLKLCDNFHKTAETNKVYVNYRF